MRKFSLQIKAISKVKPICVITFVFNPPFCIFHVLEKIFTFILFFLFSFFPLDRSLLELDFLLRADWLNLTGWELRYFQVRIPRKLTAATFHVNNVPSRPSPDFVNGQAKYTKTVLRLEFMF